MMKFRIIGVEIEVGDDTFSKGAYETRPRKNVLQRKGTGYEEWRTGPVRDYYTISVGILVYTVNTHMFGLPIPVTLGVSRGSGPSFSLTSCLWREKSEVVPREVM